MSRKITALKVQKGNKQRVNVYLDGEFAFGLARIVGAWLQIGQELSDGKIEELKNQDSVEVAYQKAVHFLSYRPRAEAEVVRNLQKRGVPEGDIEAVMERLRRNGLVDDTHFARLWIENRSEFRPRGRRALRAELRQKGVSLQVVDQALEDLDEEELAYRAARKRARRLKELEWQDFRRKLAGFLARRGFAYDIVSPIIPRVWDEIAAHKESG